MWSGCDCGFAFRTFIQHSEEPFRQEANRTAEKAPSKRARKKATTTSSPETRVKRSNKRALTCMGLEARGNSHVKNVVDEIRNESLRCLATNSLSRSSVTWVLTSVSCIRDWAWSMRWNHVKSNHKAIEKSRAWTCHTVPVYYVGCRHFFFSH